MDMNKQKALVIMQAVERYIHDHHANMPREELDILTDFVAEARVDLHSPDSSDNPAFEPGDGTEDELEDAPNTENVAGDATADTPAVSAAASRSRGRSVSRSKAK